MCKTKPYHEVIGDKCPNCEHSNVVHNMVDGECVLCQVIEKYNLERPKQEAR